MGFMIGLCLGTRLSNTHDKNPALGKYLGPAIDDGPEMLAKTTKGNDEVVHWSTYRGLKEDEKYNQYHLL